MLRVGRCGGHGLSPPWGYSLVYGRSLPTAARLGNQPTSIVSIPPANPGRSVTDIDRIEGNTLWEEKTAVEARNRITGLDTTTRWVYENITRKFARLLEARRYLPRYYEHAAIGFHFKTPGADPNFRIAVEAEIETLRAAHPDVTIRVQWEE
jgi:hypothetical protein